MEMRRIVNFISNSLLNKLMLLFLLVTLTAVVFMGYLSYETGRTAMQELLLESYENIALSKENSIAFYLREETVRVTDFSSDGYIRDTIDKINQTYPDADRISDDLSNHLFINMKPLDPYIHEINVVDLNGKVVASTDKKNIGRDASKDDLFIEGKKGVYIRDVHIHESTGETGFDTSAPVKSRTTQELVGVIFNHHGLTSLNAVTTNRKGMGESGEVYIVNKKGYMITESRFIEGAILKQRVDTEPVRLFQGQGKVMTGIYRGYRGVLVAGASSGKEIYEQFGLSWTILAEIDVAEAMALLTAPMRNRIILAGCIIAIIAVFISYFMAKSIALPIKALSGQAVKVGGGDLSIAMPLNNRTDEIGVLVQSFNKMTENLRERTDTLTDEIAERKKAEEEIRKLNEELGQRLIERDRHAVQLEEANKELESFSYSVSHDLRAPLRHINGFMQLLIKHQKGGLDEASEHYVGVIRDSVENMNELIEDLLNFSRTSGAELRVERLELSKLVESIKEELSSEVENRRITWEISPMPVVEADPSLMRVVLHNLLSNAIKYTEPRPEACIEIGARRGDIGEAIIFVRDNGVGFDMRYADKLFGVFQRLHPEGKFKGTGIGLATVRRIINRHGGRVWAEGEVDRGATFYFTVKEMV